MFQHKEREMEILKQRNDRLRTILSELDITCKGKNFIIVIFIIIIINTTITITIICSSRYSPMMSLLRNFCLVQSIMFLISSSLQPINKKRLLLCPCYLLGLQSSNLCDHFHFIFLIL